MFVYDTRKADLFVNLDHADKLTILPDGFGRWIVAAFLAGSKERTVLSEYSSYKEAEAALRRIADAVQAGRAVYDVQDQTENVKIC